MNKYHKLAIITCILWSVIYWSIEGLNAFNLTIAFFGTILTIYFILKGFFELKLIKLKKEENKNEVKDTG